MPKAKPKKYDICALHKAEYVTPRKPVLVEMGAAQYLAIQGRGEPGDKLFQAGIGALYNVAFTVKMARKFAGRDYTVSKLEGIWWDSTNPQRSVGDPGKVWDWKLMIRTPEFVTQKEASEAIGKLRAKGKPAEVSQVTLESLDEGRCVQVLHVGPYDQEHTTISQMRSFAEANGFSFHGIHHEIYLSDPRRVAPAKLRTILRHPVK
ncbi:MAG TPA: GyrI-like domain-containing protein [Candidatus Acidoferrales bacterium]|nr:GyrI-like domain-containing protein [Candidatus Acidoferrales bacterium]